MRIMYDSTGYYVGLLRRYGPDDIRCLGWGSASSQQRRFDALLSLVKKGHTVLDVGCGRGDMAQRVDCCAYRGIDTCESMVRIARERNPRHSFTRGVVDGFARDSADWVVASGLFALDHEDWERETICTVKKMYDVCHVGVAVNFLVARRDGRNNCMRYSTEKDLDAMLRRICRRRDYLYGYLPNDVTVILHRGRRAHK